MVGCFLQNEVRFGPSQCSVRNYVTNSDGCRRHVLHIPGNGEGDDDVQRTEYEEDLQDGTNEADEEKDGNFSGLVGASDFSVLTEDLAEEIMST